MFGIVKLYKIPRENCPGAPRGVGYLHNVNLRGVRPTIQRRAFYRRWIRQKGHFVRPPIFANKIVFGCKR